MKLKPIQLFNIWYQQELKLTTVSIPSACCLSTIGIDGFPNARIVSLKEVTDDGFIITSALNSNKGIEITRLNKVSLTFWWTETERQVRIQGLATQISNEKADQYFFERPRDSQLVSIASHQSQVIEDIKCLYDEFVTVDKQFENKLIPRPNDWGGYEIKPIRMEFFEFKPSRFHERQLYSLEDNNWVKKYIQP